MSRWTTCPTYPRGSVDALCRLSTGGGFATRELYTDQDEILFDAKRPVILNGIEEIVTRGDLLDRSLIVYLPTIMDGDRRQEREFWAAFGDAHPRMLGALLDAVVCALRRLDVVDLAKPPRMADFAVWVTAAEPALGWAEGSFAKAYAKNRGAGAELELEASPVAIALRAMMEALVKAAGWDPWEGTATELLKALREHAGEEATRSRDWPKSPQALGGLLRRLAPNLRAVGIGITETRRGKGRASRKIFRLETIAGNPEQPEQPEQPPSQEEAAARLLRLLMLPPHRLPRPRPIRPRPIRPRAIPSPRHSPEIPSRLSRPSHPSLPGRSGTNSPGTTPPVTNFSDGSGRSKSSIGPNTPRRRRTSDRESGDEAA